MHTVLIDTSYIYQRVTACSSWCKKANKNFSNETVYENFISSINKLSKKTGVPIKNMILCRDSWPVWRIKDYQKYKQNRSYSNDYGPYIRDLYKKICGLFEIVIRIDDAEADDIIAILAFYFLENTQDHVYVISNDKDFYQLPSLMKSQRIHLLDNSKFKEHDIEGFDINQKVIKGDNSDNVKKLKKDYTVMEYLRNKQLLDLSYVPRSIQNNIFRTGLFKLNSNNKPLSIQLGFACINTELRKQDIFCSRTVRQQTFCDKGVDYVKDLIKKNVSDLKKMVEWNYENGIRIMRISSEILPHYTNEKCPNYTLDFIREDLKEIGRLARLFKQRLTFHPSQFNVLSSPSEKVFENTRKDLRWHTDVLNMMELDQDSVMVIHGGGIYDDKAAATERFIKNFKRLDEDIQKRLVIENCEKCYNIEDMLYISEHTRAPVVFDTHHYTCYNICKNKLTREAGEYMPYVLETWYRRNIKPKFHISEQKEDARLGSHSDYIETIPDYILEIPDKYDMEIDIMIEAKMKEQAVFRLYEKYPMLSPFNN